MRRPYPSSPPPAALALSALAAAIISACSPAAQDENGRVPGGTNQQEAIGDAGDAGPSNAMPGIGAPGTGGSGTQP